MSGPLKAVMSQTAHAVRGSVLFALMLGWLVVAPAPARASACTGGPVAAAAANAATLDSIAWTPFRRAEIGWATYAPHIGQTLSTRCSPSSPGFAAALGIWQAGQKLPATGILDPATFAAMQARWTALRPFVKATRNGACPPPPDASRLVNAAAAEAYGGKVIAIRADALAAWRGLVAAARRDMPAMAADRRWLTIFSGFRHPIDDDIRCYINNNCYGVTRAACSAHRTGLAVDVFVGTAPGLRPDSSDNANRRAMSQTPVYRWLVRNARSHGFVNYVFEPWHWEYIATAAPAAALK